MFEFWGSVRIPPAIKQKTRTLDLISCVKVDKITRLDNICHFDFYSTSSLFYRKKGQGQPYYVRGHFTALRWHYSRATLTNSYFWNLVEKCYVDKCNKYPLVCGCLRCRDIPTSELPRQEQSWLQWERWQPEIKVHRHEFVSRGPPSRSKGLPFPKNPQKQKPMDNQISGSGSLFLSKHNWSWALVVSGGCSEGWGSSWNVGSTSFCL